MHELHPAGVEQRAEVVEQLRPPAAELRGPGAEQGERGEERGLGQHRGPGDQAAEAVPEQVQRLAGLLAQHPRDGDDVPARARSTE